MLGSFIRSDVIRSDVIRSVFIRSDVIRTDVIRSEGSCFCVSMAAAVFLYLTTGPELL
jgi:hypothetical protein